MGRAGLGEPVQQWTGLKGLLLLLPGSAAAHKGGSSGGRFSSWRKPSAAAAAVPWVIASSRARDCGDAATHEMHLDSGRSSSVTLLSPVVFTASFEP